MNIIPFIGKTREAAEKEAKKQLGPDITVISSDIVNVRPKGKIFARRMVRINVATEDESDKEKKIREGIASIDRARKRAEVSSVNANAAKKAGDASVTADKKAGEAQSVSGPAVSESTAAAHKNDALMEEKLDHIENLLQQKFGKDAAAKEDSSRNIQKPEADSVSVDNEKNSEREAFLKLLYKTLVDNEVNETVANQMVDELEVDAGKDVKMEHILSDIYQKIILKFGRPETIQPNGNECRIIVLIGPTGVGKTTTLAKLAANLKIKQKKNVALFTTDTYRISAAEQLRTYSNILDAPFHVLYSTEEVVEHVDIYRDYDYILVDTTGHSHRNEELKKNNHEIVEALKAAGQAEVYLVVSATTKYRDLVDVADAYKEIGDYRLIFTKLDETDALGNLLNLHMHTGAPMSYITNGQNVPGDIDIFDAQETVKKLLGGN
ncbi:MAG: flagellar biosynthesis protein FlhF [Lachnospiraceae bacterium]|nr:flagellar biosynthesis protein FlhF [Lachnospiraceae bacterium]